MTTREQMLWRVLGLHDSRCEIRQSVDGERTCTCGISVAFRCPTCGYLVSEVDMKYARLDFDCSRCGRTTLADFEPQLFLRPAS